jgi:hypothetical protein
VTGEPLPPDVPSRWAVAGGPEEIVDSERDDVRVAWAWTIQRGADRRTVRVLVTGQAVSVPVDAGRTLVESNLRLDEPPLTIVLTT